MSSGELKESETRKRILEATRQLMEGRSGRGVGMRDVAEAAGVSRQAVYDHFGSRAELMVATARYGDRVLGLEERKRRYGAANGGVESLEAYVEFWCNYIPEIYGVAKALLEVRETDEAAAAWDDRMAEHCDNILRVAGSLLTRTVRASDILEVLQADGRPRSLGKAIAELGKLPKTVHLFNYLNDGAYRRTIGGQLNPHEQRHSLARAVFFSKKGDVRKRYREGQEDQLGALGFVVNAVSLWNTRYTGLALETLALEGFEASIEDVERLSPLRHEHVNLLSRYQFSLAEDPLRCGMRPLRRPGVLGED